MTDEDVAKLVQQSVSKEVPISEDAREHPPSCSLGRRPSVSSLSDEDKYQTLHLLITCSIDIHQSTIYDVVRLGNLELFTLLMRRLERAEAPDGGCGPQIQQLQDAYVELKYKNVPLSSHMQTAVEQQLLDCQFFCEKTSVTVQEIIPTLEDVRQRVELILQLVEDLRARYSTGELDEQFAFLGRSVAQNIHILRRQMRGTYNVLPWDEILFCLVIFISCVSRREESESFYYLVLDKKNMLNQLTNFAESLSSVDLEKKDWQKKRVATSRSKIIEDVVKMKPSFETLYKDYEMIRNIYSLKRILKYVNLALTVNSREHGTIGALVIQRALQVMGECLKNTPDSPHVSADVHRALGRDAPRAARETLTGLRNLLSHAHTLDEKLRLESDPDFFYSLQRDLRKIEAEIAVILGKKRLETVTHFLNKILKIDNLDDLTELHRTVRHLNFTKIDEVVKSTADIELIQDLLRQLEEELGDQTREETLFIEDIKEIIKSREKRKTYSSDSVKNFSTLFNSIKYHNNIITFKKCCQMTLQEITTSQNSTSNKLNTIIPLLSSTTTNSSTKRDVMYLCYKIFCIVSFEEMRIKGIETLNDSLLQTETVSQAEIENTIRGVFSKVQKRLVSHDSKISVKRALDSQKQVYENKLKLLNLCNSSAPDLGSFVTLLKEMNYKPRNVKELADKYGEGKFKECRSRLNIVVVEYESLTRTLSKGHLLSYKYYNEALDAFFGALKLEKILKSEVMGIIEGLKDERKREISSYYDKRLTLLKHLFDCNKCGTLHLSDAGDQGRAAVESLVLDLTEILDNNGLFVDSRLLYDEYSAVLIGKNLRNYLAHGDTLTDVLLFEPAVAIACTGAKLILEGKDLVTRTDTLIGRRTVFDIKKLKETQGKYRRIVAKQNDMFLAARDDNLERLRASVDEGADVLGRDLNGWTGLHFAAERNSVKTFANLLGQNLNVAIKDKYYRTPLHVAFMHGSLQIVQVLEDLKLFDAKHDEIINLLYSAAENGHHALINKMLRDKSVPEKYLCEPFYIAIQMGHKKVVEELLKTGLNLNAVTKASIPPLHMAAFCGHKELIILLLENSAEVDAEDERGMSALFWAMMGGSTDNALILLDWGANVNALSDDDMTPLLMALREEQEECALALLEKNAAINCKDENYWTALHYAADGLEKAVEVLLDKGSNVHDLTKSKYTALYIASKGGYDRIVRALISKGANVHCQTSNNKTALHAAAYNGHRYAVEVLLQSGARAGDRTHCGWTALHMAAKGGHKDVVETLINYGADIDTEGEQHQNPLHLAALNGHTEIVRMLTKLGAKLNATTMDHLTALHLAVQHDHEDTAALLLQLGADVRAVADDHCTALHMAANLGNAAVARLLIENNAPVDALTESKFTPLFLAVRGGHASVVDLLLDKGADIKTPGGDMSVETPLMRAARDDHKDIVSALLEKQTHVDDHRKENAKALDLAAGRGFKDIVILLISKGKSNINSFSPLHSAATTGHGDVVSVLLDNNADINARGVGGSSALYAAAENGHVDVVKILVSRQAEVNAATDRQWTALHVAALNGHTEVAQALVENDADVEAKTAEDNTALYLAAMKGFCSVVELLLQSGAHVDSARSDNRTALHGAVLNGHGDVVRILLDNGANVFSTCGDGFTALQTAARGGHLEMVRFIIDHLITHESDYGLVKFVNTLSDSGLTPLHLAAGNGHKDVVVLLIQKGAHINAVSRSDESALHWAARDNHIDVVRVLLKEGIDADLVNNSNARALDFAALKGNADAVEELVRHGADIFFKGPNKTTVLHTAVMSGKECCVNVLINLAKEKGENSLEEFVNSPDGDKWTALHLAAQNGHREIVSVLLQSAADVNAEDTDDWTALHVAARNGREGVVAQLLAAGADAQSQIGDRATALHLAAMSGFTNIVEMLLNFVKVNRPDNLYAFINHRDVNNCTALQLARLEGRTEIVQTLQRHEIDSRGLILSAICDKFVQVMNVLK